MAISLSGAGGRAVASSMGMFGGSRSSGSSSSRSSGGGSSSAKKTTTPAKKTTTTTKKATPTKATSKTPVSTSGAAGKQILSSISSQATNTKSSSSSASKQVSPTLAAQATNVSKQVSATQQAKSLSGDAGKQVLTSIAKPATNVVPTAAVPLVSGFKTSDGKVVTTPQTTTLNAVQQVKSALQTVKASQVKSSSAINILDPIKTASASDLRADAKVIAAPTVVTGLDKSVDDIAARVNTLITNIGSFSIGGRSYLLPVSYDNKIKISDIKNANPSLASALESVSKEGTVTVGQLQSLTSQKLKVQSATADDILPGGVTIGSLTNLGKTLDQQTITVTDVASPILSAPVAAQLPASASNIANNMIGGWGYNPSGFNMALSNPSAISGVLGPATSGHPADNAYPLGNAEDGGWLDCGAIMPTTFEWTMPAGKIPGGYVDAFGAVMSRADYVTKYNVDPEYALWYMRSNQAAKDLKAQQQSYSQPYVATPLAQAITPMSQIMAGVSPVSAGSYSYSGGGGSYSGGSGVQVWTEEPGLPVAPSAPETTKSVTEEDLEDMSLDQLATLYLSNFTVSGDVSKVDLKKLKTDDPDFYNDLLQSKAIAAADTSVSLVKAVNAWVTANTPKPVTTTEPETPTPTEPTTTTEDTSDLTLEEATVLYLSQFTQSSNAARIDTAKLLNGDPQMYNDLIKAGIITTASMSVPLLTAANAWVAYATKAGSTVAPIYTSPVAQQPVTPVVEVPAKKMLQISFKKYNIPDAGIKLTKILDDVPELIADRSRRQSFTKVLTSIAGSDGVLDMDEVSRLNSISGVPIRLV